jgi:rhodanese-related sulfurtransferase
VQATDQYVGTLGARIVLIDDAEVRAVMTASWLRQMGWQDVFVLAETGDETGFPASPVLGSASPNENLIGCAELSEMLADETTTVVDLSLSSDYAKAHIPGAWFAIRARLAQALAKIAPPGALVLTSEDGVLAGLAVPEVQALTAHPVRALRGGNAAWKAAGYALANDARMADEPLDVWLKPYERPGDTAGAMTEYLSWETDLLDRVARDGSCHFSTAPGSVAKV